jgi:Fe2+ or Zn2+ uptake regulation protein
MERKTRQKKTILEVLRSTKTHPTADWIYDEARKTIPNISKGTVYRNLKNLTQAGIIAELKIDGNASRYDGTSINHYHFKCEKCSGVFDLDIPVATELDEKVSLKTGFMVRGHNVEFFGLCPSCRNSKLRSV